MSFTDTFIGNGPGPTRLNEGEHGEIHSYVNTAGFTGGTITAKFLKVIDRVEGDGILTHSISGKTVTITTDANAAGNLTLYGR